MKRFAIGIALAFTTCLSFGATLVPVQMLNPTGSAVAQALVSSGASSAPSWQAVANSVAGRTGTVTLSVGDVSGAAPLTSPTFTNISASGAITGFSGRLLGVRVFTASTTYTPTTGTQSILVYVQGGAGGSGGNAATSGTQNAASGGGGAGAGAAVYITSGFSGAAITIGSGGTPGAAGANAGGAGGTTSFGGLVSCPGGGGGAGGAAISAGPAQGGIGGGGGAACTLSGVSVIVNYPGQGGTPGAVFSVGLFIRGGDGGSSLLGVGAANNQGSTVPIFGSGYGSGPSGMISVASSAASAGAVGEQGVVVIYEYSN